MLLCYTHHDDQNRLLNNDWEGEHSERKSREEGCRSYSEERPCLRWILKEEVCGPHARQGRDFLITNSNMWKLEFLKNWKSCDCNCSEDGKRGAWGWKEVWSQVRDRLKSQASAAYSVSSAILWEASVLSLGIIWIMQKFDFLDVSQYSGMDNGLGREPDRR